MGDHARSASMRAQRWRSASWQFWLLTAFLSLVAFTGGSSRDDVQSLALLWPVSFIVLAIGAMSLQAADVRRCKVLVIFAALFLLLTAAYCLALPAGWLPASPFGDLAGQIGSLAGAENQRRSAAILPLAAQTSLFALVAPLAVLVLAMQLDRNDCVRLMPVLLILGLASAILGVLQILGDPLGPLYFYRITNNGAAVGLFANRNHQALLLICLFPMLAAYLAIQKRRRETAQSQSWIAIAVAVFLIPLILVTGSRAGVVFGLVALLLALLIYKSAISAPTASGKLAFVADWRVWASLIVTVLLAFITLLFSRAEAIERIFADDQSERVDFWQPVARMALDNMPLGIGPGSFPAAYAKIEPMAQLDSSYLNRAHNDWLEFVVSFGAPGIALILAGLIAVAIRGFSLLKDRDVQSRGTVQSRLGLSILLLTALASIVDYPLRTPFIGCVAVVALVWFHGSVRPGEHGRSGR